MSITASSEENPKSPRRSNLTLWLILAVCVLPFIASVALYLFWRPDSFVNYGDLIEPLPLSETTLKTLEGGALRFDEMRGKWVFLTVDGGTCDEYCRKKLYWMRQVRLAQGADQERIERLWLVTDGTVPAAELAVESEDVRTVVLADPSFVGNLPAPASPAEHIYLVDPLGNLMMRYPRDLDPNRMKKDVGKLLRLSKGWRQLSR
jgi:hypothetical protein